MAIELVPAVSRQLKSYSTWIAIATAIFDILYVTLESLQDQLEPHTFALINATLVAGIKIANVIKQNIPATEEQKQAIVEHVEALPTKPTKE